MKALIVAAGQGLRLRGIAASKPLAPVGGAPLIEHVIDAAVDAGVDAFVVVTGYEGVRLERRLAETAARRGLSITCVHNPAWECANGVSVLAAQAELGEAPFLLMMADHLFDPTILRDLAALPGEGVTLAVDRRLDNPLVDLDDVTRVETDGEGRIRRIGKGLAAHDAFDVGLFRAGPALLDALREDVATGGAGSISAGMQRLADAGLARTFDIGARFWLDVDDEPAFRLAERHVGASARAASL